MGLSSGNRWAVANLDVMGPYFFQESPFQYGCSYFSWGNVTPHNPINETDFEYNFGGRNSSAPWYEGQPYGETPGSLLTGNIPLTNDAARRMLSSPWRMPSSADFTELFNNVIFIDANGEEVDPSKRDKRVTVNGVLGIYLQSKINGARLFFATSGYGAGNKLSSGGITVVCWSTTVSSVRNAYSINFNATTSNPRIVNDRYYGFPIRPIWNPDDLRR